MNNHIVGRDSRYIEWTQHVEVRAPRKIFSIKEAARVSGEKPAAALNKTSLFKICSFKVQSSGPASREALRSSKAETSLFLAPFHLTVSTIPRDQSRSEYRRQRS